MTTTAPRTAMLTQLRLNPRHPATGRELANVDGMHRRVMSLFPDSLGDNPRSEAGVLHRVEHNHAAAVVLIQSTLTPDITRLPHGYANAAHRELDPLLSGLESGTRIRYRIVANPTRVETTDDGRKHRRQLSGDHALSWWHRRAEEAGLDLESAMLTREYQLVGDKPRHARRTHYHGAAQFDGTATVTHPETIFRAVLDGIGRAKSYGCGMLSLVPMTDGDQ
ncbi:CRISPR system Cascade subunit CasE [Actinopolyspora alba]|uniref:CRISPR system Cascade subunit CasE n=1 Tax=Actinopolyspora alba TaxID=673379 RepID=A0A1I2CIZ1_9ACTN|nr:type I-E CRISPR-associated protein Cas6/Cse3/CasE [Actinopolyspora alba]SFE68085.1 CRISPR system Cascade subunit CasE [Actinopolyspora alba]